MILSNVKGKYLAIAATLVLGLVSTSVSAATITNRDDTPRSLRFVEGDKRTERQLAPGKSVEDVCKDGCIVRIDGKPDKDFVLEGTERVSIEGGLMYYDGEVVRKTEPRK